MADSNVIRFRCLGRFVTFVPGKKSPYKKILLKAVQFDGASGEVMNEVEIKLDKSLRKKMSGDWETGDWVRVAGEGKATSRSEKIKWKARKAARLSPRQVKKQQAEFAYKIAAGALTNGKAQTDFEQLKKPLEKQTKKAPAAKLSNSAVQPAVQPAVQIEPSLTKVLICQKGSCRKKGSLKVAQAVDSVLAEAGCAEGVKVKATGCMGHCKAGPNMVLLPAKDKYRKVTPKKARSLIAQSL